jgi:hypothetical protein
VGGVRLAQISHEIASVEQASPMAAGSVSGLEPRVSGFNPNPKLKTRDTRLGP